MGGGELRVCEGGKVREEGGRAAGRERKVGRARGREEEEEREGTTGERGGRQKIAEMKALG